MIFGVDRLPSNQQDAGRWAARLVTSRKCIKRLQYELIMNYKLPYNITENLNDELL